MLWTFFLKITYNECVYVEKKSVFAFEKESKFYKFVLIERRVEKAKEF